MPVTFQTDLNDIKERPYVQQLPLDAMFRGMGYKQAEYDQGVQQAKAIAQGAANVLRGYGPDEGAAADIRDQINEQVQAFSGQDFSRPDVVNQFNSYISGILNSPDVRGIAARTAKREADDKLMQEYQEKGKEVPLFLQPSVKQRMSYEASGKYDPNVRYRGNITTAPDVKTWLKEINDKLQPDVDAHGTKYVSAERFAKALQADLKFRPEMEQFLRLEHDASVPEGFDWDTQATESFGAAIERNNQRYVIYQQEANKAEKELQAAQASKDQKAITSAFTKYQQASRLAEDARASADIARTQLNSRDKGYFFHKKSQDDYINNIIDQWSDAQEYSQQGVGEREKLFIQRETEYGAIARRGELEREIEQMKIDNAGGGGLAPTLLLNQFYEATAGMSPEGGAVDANFWSDDVEYNKANPVTSATLQDVFGVENAANTAGNNSWVPIGTVPDVVRKSLDMQTDRDANGNLIRQTNLALDDKGNYLIFRSSDGKRLGYVKEVYNKDTEESVKQFEVMDETAAKAKGMIGKSLKEQQAVAKRTREQYDQEKAANRAASAPTSPGYTKVQLQDGTVGEIPSGNVSKFLTDNPGSKELK